MEAGRVEGEERKCEGNGKETGRKWGVGRRSGKKVKGRRRRELCKGAATRNCK